MGAKLQLLPKLRQRETRTYCSRQSLSCLHTHSCHTRRLKGNGTGSPGWEMVCPTHASYGGGGVPTHCREQARPLGTAQDRVLTSIHVASMVGTTEPSPSPSTTDVPSSSPSSEVGGWGYFIVHGTPHAEPRVMWLDGRKDRQLTFTSLSNDQRTPAKERTPKEFRAGHSP